MSSRMPQYCCKHHFCDLIFSLTELVQLRSLLSSLPTPNIIMLLVFASSTVMCIEIVIIIDLPSSLLS